MSSMLHNSMEKLRDSGFCVSRTLNIRVACEVSSFSTGMICIPSCRPCLSPRRHAALSPRGNYFTTTFNAIIHYRIACSRDTVPCRSRTRIDHERATTMISIRRVTVAIAAADNSTCRYINGKWCAHKDRWRCKKIFRKSRLSEVSARIKAVCPQFINIAELQKRLGPDIALTRICIFFIEMSLTLI